MYLSEYLKGVQVYIEQNQKFLPHKVFQSLAKRGYVNRLIDRILVLEGHSSKAETPVYNNPIEWIKYDLKISQDGLTCNTYQRSSR